MHPFVIIQIYIRDLCPFLCLLNEFNSIETSALNLYWEADEVEGIFFGISLPWPQRSGSALRSSTPEASGHRGVRNLFLLRGRKTEVQCFFLGILFMNVHQKAGLASPHLPVAGADLCGTKHDDTCYMDSCWSWATVITRAINTSTSKTVVLIVLQRMCMKFRDV